MQVMHVEQPSPETLYTDVSQSAKKSIASIQSFAILVKDSKSQEILVKANGSRMRNKEGITGWLVTQHPNWLDRAIENGVKEMRLDEAGDTNGENPSDVLLEDPTSILDKFREEHPGVDLSMVQESKSIKVHMLVHRRMMLRY